MRAQVFREELGWLAGLLGAVRDLDVQLQGLAGLSFADVHSSLALGPTATTPWSNWRRFSSASARWPAKTC